MVKSSPIDFYPQFAGDDQSSTSDSRQGFYKATM